jgi:deazaflavin-dependent oxidoreductase (nitroreductase family)
MGAAILIVLAALVGAILVIAGVYMLGIRSKNSAVLDAARRFHHSLGNPVQMRRAGNSGTFSSVIKHQGRTTGRTYETPVWAVPTEDGFAIAIVYGSRTDWVKNVFASGEAVIVHDGDAHPVHQPEIVPRDSVREYFPATLQRIHRRIHVEQCLRVRRVKVATTSTARILGG